MGDLCIVIPTHRRAGQLARSLRRLAAQVDAPPFEVIVVSDAADPAAAAAGDAVVASGLTEARHLQATVPGASAARNVGWRASAAPVVLFLDDDVLATPRLAAEHASVHGAEPEAHVAVMGLVRWHPELTVTPFMRWLDHGVHFNFPAAPEEDIGWGRFYTANVSVKRALLEAAGGFDEVAFPFHYEDLDLGRRAFERIGLAVRYRPAASADHLHAVTRDAYARRIHAIAAAERRFVARYPDQTPFYRRLLESSLDHPPVRGTSGRLAGVVGPGFPWLGRRVWFSFDLATRQALAPPYLEAWDAAGDDVPPSPAPDLPL
jgi:GT2 family glycosyltransferase